MRRALKVAALGGLIALVAAAVVAGAWGPGWVEGELRRQAAARGWQVEWASLSLGLGEVELVGVRAARGRVQAAVERMAVTPRWTREGVPVERVEVEGARVEVELGGVGAGAAGGAGEARRWDAIPPIAVRGLTVRARRGGAVAEAIVESARWDPGDGAEAIGVRGWVEAAGARVDGTVDAARWAPGEAASVEGARAWAEVAGLRVDAAADAARWAPGEVATLDGARLSAEGRGVAVEAPAQTVWVDVEGRAIEAAGVLRVGLGAPPSRPRAVEVGRARVGWTATGPTATVDVAGGVAELAIEGPPTAPDGLWVEATGLDLAVLARWMGREGVTGRVSGALWISRPLDARDGLIGQVAVDGGSLSHPAVAPEPVDGIEGIAYGVGWRDGMDGTGDLDGTWHLAWAAATGEVRAGGTLDGMGFDRDAHLRLRGELEPVACDAAWRAVPAALRGAHADARFGGKAFDDDWVAQMPGCAPEQRRRAARRGLDDTARCDPSTFAPSVDLDLPLSEPFDLRLRTRGIAGACPVAKLDAAAPPLATVEGRRAKHMTDVDWLLDDFTHPVDANPPHDRVGPGDPSWVDPALLPAFVPAVMYLSEDRSLFDRPGAVDMKLISRALKFDLDRGRYVYGGSTLPQQLVKNLFLRREKTLARKLQEAVIANRVTVAIPPERVLGLYINCIEFAPGVYGLRRAARHYFGVAPGALTPAQAVFLATAKPSPRYAETLRRRGSTPDTEHYRTYMRRLYDRLVEVGALTEADVAAQGPLRVTFEGAQPYPE